MPTITLNSENLQKISAEHGLTKAEIATEKEELSDFLESIKSTGQGFYDILDDQTTIEKIKQFTESTKNTFKHIVVLGIGGSALGASCLHKSLTPLITNSKNPELPKLHIIDNIDPDLIEAINALIDYSKTLFLVITKSGTTPETLSQYRYFKAKCEAKKLAPQTHFVFITDPKQGELRKIAQQENITTFEVPQNVGGRFSVLTAVGLVPAALIGIDIEKLISGAKQIRENFLNTNTSENIAYQLSTIQYLLSQKGKNINVMMPYSQKLTKLADWYRQLLAESIGKKHNRKDEEVFTGITPIKALGATDQHSQIQLYNEGPNDKLVIFIEIENYDHTVQIPEPYNISFNTLIKTEKKGTEQALTKNDRPNITIKIPTINEETIGELIMLFEASIALLGEHFDIDAFNQPGVELSKIITKNLLKNN